MAVRMVPAIHEALLATMKSAVQTKQFDTVPAGYAGVARGIINKIVVCKNMSNKIESLHIQLDMTQWSAFQANIQFNHVLAREGDRRATYLKVVSQYPDAQYLKANTPINLDGGSYTYDTSSAPNQQST